MAGPGILINVKVIPFWEHAPNLYGLTEEKLEHGFQPMFPIEPTIRRQNGTCFEPMFQIQPTVGRKNGTCFEPMFHGFYWKTMTKGVIEDLSGRVFPTQK